jgi:hypothetical protein
MDWASRNRATQHDEQSENTACLNAVLRMIASDKPTCGGSPFHKADAIAQKAAFAL